MPSADPVSQKEVARIAAALRTAVRLSGVSQREIERDLELSTGYLTRILAGQVQLRLAHVLEICRVIELPAESFFAALYPPRPPATQLETRLLRGLSQLHPGQVHTRDPESLLHEIRALLDELVALRKRAVP